MNASSTSYDKHLHGSPVYFKDDNNNEYIYAWAEGGLLKQFPFNRSTMLFDTLNTIAGNTALPYGMPGAMLAVSSNGNETGTGILWASHPINGDANQAVVPGILQAFDATNVTHELWNSNMSGIRDAIGNFAKFVPPTIANGKVYMATFSNAVNVYGLNPPVASTCSYPLPAPWRSADVGYVIEPGDVCDSSGTFTVTASGDDIWNAADAFHYVYQPVTGNSVQIIARVKSMQNTDPWSKCGVMFRANLDAGSPQAMMSLTVGNGVAFQDRLVQSGQSNNTNYVGFNTPYWVSLVKSGNVYTSYFSSDGVSWTSMGSATIAMGSFPYVGIAYTSHDNSTLGSAVVDNVSVYVNGTLPVDVVNFGAKNISNKYASLSWNTVNEINTDHYDIQRSSGSTDFSAIGTVKSNAAKSSSNTYSFDDNAPLNGINFYRLKEVDKDGKITYSNVATVNFNFNLVAIYPNPVRNAVFIRNNSNFSGDQNLTILLSNALGQILLKQSAGSAGNNVITINLPANIVNGVYVLQVINAKGQRQARKIFINR